jgi:hypothetical protein
MTVKTGIVPVESAGHADTDMQFHKREKELVIAPRAVRSGAGRCLHAVSDEWLQWAEDAKLFQPRDTIVSEAAARGVWWGGDNPPGGAVVQFF